MRRSLAAAGNVGEANREKELARRPFPHNLVVVSGNGINAVSIREAPPRLEDVKVIFRQEGPLSSGNHYGCRIVQGRDGNLWLTLGDHFKNR